MQIPLMSCERAWAYAMQLKFELNTEPRKKYHMINRCDEKKWLLLDCLAYL
jgi:signal recognition particle subunit SRP68